MTGEVSAGIDGSQTKSGGVRGSLVLGGGTVGRAIPPLAAGAMAGPGLCAPGSLSVFVVVGEGALFVLFLNVLLEVAHLVRDEGEDVVEGEPFEVGGVLGDILAEAVEFGEEAFGFHGDTIAGGVGRD